MVNFLVNSCPFIKPADGATLTFICRHVSGHLANVSPTFTLLLSLLWLFLPTNVGTSRLFVD